MTGGPPIAFVIRVATPDDDVALMAVEQASYSSKSAFPSSRPAPGASFFTESSPPEVHLVAAAGSELLGYVRIKPHLDVAECAHVLAVHGLGVAPGARRRGVGSALMLAAAMAARDGGARKLSLRVFGGNTEARRFYESLGYTVEGALTEEFLIDGTYVDDVLMTLHLT